MKTVKKLKAFAKVCYIVGLVFAIQIAVASIVVACDSDKWYIPLFAGFFIAAFGLGISYLCYLFLLSYLDMVENTHIIKAKLTGSEKLLAKPGPVCQPKKVATIAQQPTRQTSGTYGNNKSVAQNPVRQAPASQEPVEIKTTQSKNGTYTITLPVANRVHIKLVEVLSSMNAAREIPGQNEFINKFNKTSR